LGVVQRPPEEKADPALLEKAAEHVQEIYSRNVWPRMNITWGTYVNHIGHYTDTHALPARAACAATAIIT
jgi:hypothetical protein